MFIRECIIFFCVATAILILEDTHTSVNAVQKKPLNIVSWQVNTLEPTDEQLKKLYSFSLSENIEVDDSAVDYKTVGIYPLLFRLQDGQAIAKEIKIQIKSPVLVKELPVLQLEVGEQLELSSELLQSYLGSEEKNGYSYEVTKENINMNKIGKYEVGIEITDPYGRKKVTTIFAEVVDLQVPKLTLGKQKLSYIVGSKMTADKLEKDAVVQATDNYSKELTYDWDLDKLNFQLAGEYEIGVFAKDESGNVSETKYITVSVGPDTVLKNSLQYEVNKKESEADVIDDLASPMIEKIAYEQIDFSTVSSYRMDVYLIGDLKTTVEINIVDKTAPSITSKITQLEYENAEQFTEAKLKEDLQLEVNDNYDKQVTVYFSKSMDELRRSGQHQLTVYAIDQSGNIAELAVSLKMGQQEVVPPIKKETNVKKDSNKEEQQKVFRNKTIYAASETEQIETIELESFDQVATTLTSNDVKDEASWTKLLMPVIWLMLLLFIAVAIRTRKKQMNKKSRRKQKSFE